MSQMFQYEVSSPYALDKLHTVDDFIGGFFFLFFFVGCVDGVQYMYACALLVTILHIESFVTIDFDSYLTSRLITDSDFDQIK